MSASVHWLQDLFIRALSALAADTACRVGAGLGVLAFHLGVRRKVASRNLTACLGLRGRERARVLRRSYATMGAAFFEVWTIGGPAGPEHTVTVANPLWLKHVRQKYRSGVFISAHLGSWDLGAHSMTRDGSEVAVYAKAQHNAYLDAALNRARGRAGLDVLLLTPGDRSSAVKALKRLRAGALLCMLADQWPHAGLPAWFLGQATMCHEGPAFFAHKAQVPLIPGIAIRVRAGVVRILLGRPRYMTGDKAADVQTSMDLLSAMIATYPGQFFWQHRRFRDCQVEVSPRATQPWQTQGLGLMTNGGAGCDKRNGDE